MEYDRDRINQDKTSKVKWKPHYNSQYLADMSKNGEVIMNTGTHQKLQLQNLDLRH